MERKPFSRMRLRRSLILKVLPRSSTISSNPFFRLTSTDFTPASLCTEAATPRAQSPQSNPYTRSSIFRYSAWSGSTPNSNPERAKLRDRARQEKVTSVSPVNNRSRQRRPGHPPAAACRSAGREAQTGLLPEKPGYDKCRGPTVPKTRPFPPSFSSRRYDLNSAAKIPAAPHRRGRRRLFRRLQEEVGRAEPGQPLHRSSPKKTANRAWGNPCSGPEVSTPLRSC